MAIERVVLPGSERSPLEGARVVGTPNPSDVIQVTLMMRRRRPLNVTDDPPRVSRQHFAARYGADPADFPPIEAFAQEFNLTIVAVDFARRSVELSGTVAAMSEAFGSVLKLYQSPEGVYRGRAGALYLPVALTDIVIGVFGLDGRPQAHARCRRIRNVVGPRAAGDTSYTPVDVAKLYSFPSNANGAGETVAIIELGGGYAQSDLQAYFGALGQPVPSVTAVSVDGATNTPTGDPSSADGEVLLDIEVVGAVASGAKIAVYFAPNTDQGFLDAISTAVHDSVRGPSIVSISWGGPESTWTQQALQAFDQAFQDAAVLGVTVCCASGDDGSRDGVSDGQAHVDFPAASPHVLACGGTRLESSGASIRSEVVWNEGAGNGASGGGVSEVFAKPAYQQQANVPASVNPSHFKGRGVPDVCGDADPRTGYRIHVDGIDAVFGGTSAVAPLWSALLALINQRLGKKLGYLNPVIYVGPADPSAFRDITSGTNGAYSAGAGWDACTGLGSPNGVALLNALSGRAAAGSGTRDTGD